MFKRIFGNLKAFLIFLILCWISLGGFCPKRAMAASGAVLQADSVAKNVYIKAETTKSKVYTGEPVVVNYWLYHAVPIIDPQQEFKPTFQDCFVEAFPEKELHRKEKIKGQTFQVKLLKKYLIVPQKEGRVEIPALSQVFKMNAPPDPNDFFGVEQVISTKVNSNPLSLQVLKLPDAPDSAFFSGAIGKFRFEYNYTQDQKHGNLLHFRFKITGPGNLKNLRFKPPVLPNGTEMFNETSSGSQEFYKDNWLGKHEYTYQVMAHYQGIYTLPAGTFWYFDPEKGTYATYEIPAFSWEVREGPKRPENLVKAALPQTPKAELKLKDSFNSRNFTVLGTPLVASFAVLGLAGFVFLGGLVMAEKKRQRDLDPEGYQFREALKKYLKILRILRKQLPKANEDQFSGKLLEVLRNYLAAKIKRPGFEIKIDNLPSLMETHKVPVTLQKEVLVFMAVHYRYRFSPIKAAPKSQAAELDRLEILLQTIEPYFNGKTV